MDDSNTDIYLSKSKQYFNKWEQFRYIQIKDTRIAIKQVLRGFLCLYRKHVFLQYFSYNKLESITITINVKKTLKTSFIKQLNQKMCVSVKFLQDYVCERIRNVIIETQDIENKDPQFGDTFFLPTTTSHSHNCKRRNSMSKHMIANLYA